MRRELARDLVQDQAKKGERFAIRADPAAVATATPVSHSSYGGPNAGQVKDGHGQDRERAVEGFGRGELTAMDLIAARFFVRSPFFGHVDEELSEKPEKNLFISASFIVHLERMSYLN